MVTIIILKLTKNLQRATRRELLNLTYRMKIMTRINLPQGLRHGRRNGMTS